MKHKITLVFVLLSLFLGFNFASADVIINEVAWMGTIDSQYGEWIELYNNGSSDVDLSNWKLYEEGGGILIFTLSKTIPQHGFLLIERTTASITDPIPGINDESGSFAGSGLSNDGEFLVLKDLDGNSVDSLNFSSGWPAGDATTKETMQRSGSGWITALNTPGSQNTSSVAGGSTSSSGSSSGSSSNNNDDEVVEEKTKIVAIPTIKTKILSSTLAFAGQPLEIKTSLLGYSNEKLVLGKIYWNFGDGGSFEQVNNFEKFTHTYYYPGEYIMSLEYYLNNKNIEPDAVNKIVVKVIPTTVTISKIGDVKDFFIELTNNASSDMDISNWYIKAGNKTFKIPRNTSIISKKQMTISSKITGFNITDKYNLKLYSSTNELVFDYNNKYVPAKSLVKNTSSIKKDEPVLLDEREDILDIGKDVELGAALGESDFSKNNKFYFLLALFLILITASTLTVYFIRRNNVKKEESDDFEILDE